MSDKDARPLVLGGPAIMITRTAEFMQRISILCLLLGIAWAAGACQRYPTLPISASPTPTGSPLTLSADTSPESRGQLVQLLKEIHNQYEIDPSQGCFDLRAPYEDYHQGLQKMTVILLTHPLAAAFSLDEREDIFTQVVGFKGVKFIPGNGKAVLVVIPTNRGYSLGCGYHYASPSAFHVVDKNGAIWNIGTEGRYKDSWWINDRWVIRIQLKLDTSSGPTRWAIWHVGQTQTGWHRVVNYGFEPPPYDIDSFPLHFDDGYTTMIADLEYWRLDDPCEFTKAFRMAYEHGDWKTRETYQLTEGSYQRVDIQVTDFGVYQKDTRAKVSLKWQDYCIGPISPQRGSYP